MSKLYYTASGIVTPIGGSPVHKLREEEEEEEEEEEKEEKKRAVHLVTTGL